MRILILRIRHWFPASAAAAAAFYSSARITTSRRLVSTDAASVSTSARTLFGSFEMTTTANAIIDVDCNLWHDDLKSLLHNDKPPLSILQEDAIEKANIIAILSPSSTIQQANNGLELLKTWSHDKLPILTTVGVHPYHVHDSDILTNEPSKLVTYYDEMKKLVQDNPTLVCAIGECGLDGSPGFPPIPDQIPWFQLQIQLAQELHLPLFVHERAAFDDTMELLQHFTGKVIIHCFTGTVQECQAYIRRGYSISVSGYICKPTDSDDDTRACLSQHSIPLSKLMLETDAPYMGFAGCRQLYLEKNVNQQSTTNTQMNSKQRKRLQQGTYPNVPSSLPMVLEQVATLMGIPKEEVAQQTTSNAMAFFGFQRQSQKS